MRTTADVLLCTECFESVSIVCDWKQQNVSGLPPDGWTSVM